MHAPSEQATAKSVGDRPVLRVVAYYALLAAGVAILWRVSPATRALFSAERLEELTGPGGAIPPLDATGAGAAAAVPLTAGLSVAGALLLMLPVVWVYILTRRKKGFRQSIVQTLLLLPTVVAGIILIVKNSVALAFSLAGIVGAVSFRNTLRDTKDAVYIFLAIAVGIAAGVQAMAVAAIVSILFNAVVLVLWWTDFGRAPAALEGRLAARRLRRARDRAGGSGKLVSVLDREILKSLAPEQLDALAERAWRRRREARDLPAGKRRLTHRLRVRVSDRDAARPAIESALDAGAKAWEFRGWVGDDGAGAMADYRFRPRKSVPPAQLIESLLARADAGVLHAEVE